MERVYGFPGKEQASVFASIPEPVGYQSKDVSYSPIWLMYTVTWTQRDRFIELRSEEAILTAQDMGWVDVKRIDIVVNCPIVQLGSCF